MKIQLEKIEERLGKAPRICNLINSRQKLGKYYLAKLDLIRTPAGKNQAREGNREAFGGQGVL